MPVWGEAAVRPGLSGRAGCGGAWERMNITTEQLSVRYIVRIPADRADFVSSAAENTQLFSLLAAHQV